MQHKINKGMKKTIYSHGHRWTNEQIKEIMNLWSQEIEAPIIAEKMNSSLSAISKLIVRLRAEGIPLKRRQRGHKLGRSNQLWTQSEIEFLVRRRMDNVSCERIGLDLGRSYNSVNAMVMKLRNEGVSVPMYGQGVRRLWDADILKATLLHAKPDECKIVDMDLEKDKEVEDAA